MTALEALSQADPSVPLSVEAFADRAYRTARNPLRNPVKEIMDAAPSVEETPPMLGIFNDIPWHRYRESEAHAWAQAGFLWVVNDGEHSQWEGYYGREQNASILRLGMLPVQRLPREAISTHGDALQLGARATMRPYGITAEESTRYFQSITFPTPGAATPYDRGGFPVRGGDRTMYFSPSSLREAEGETQGWVQFETDEYIRDTSVRDRVLDIMASRGRNRACGFVGPFDALMRSGNHDAADAVASLIHAAAVRNIHMGILVSPGSTDNARAMEESMVRMIDLGARLLAVHVMTSDLTYRGAAATTEPFFRACRRCGF